MPADPPSYRSFNDLGDPVDSWLLRQIGYRTDVVILSDGQFYWHVWLHGDRVNGGLSESWTAAHEDAVRASRQDNLHRNTLRW
jgi:hypothetical protein